MASTIDNVQVGFLNENGEFNFMTDDQLKLEISRQGDCVVLYIHSGKFYYRSVVVLRFAQFSIDHCKLNNKENNKKIFYDKNAPFLFE